MKQLIRHWLIIVLAILPVAAAAQTATVTFSTWQEMAAYVFKQTAKLNEHTATIKAYEARIAELERLAAVQGAALTGAIDYTRELGTQYSNMLYMLILEACSWNLNASGIAAVLPFYKPFNLGNHTCPTTAPPWRWKVPQYPSAEDAAAAAAVPPAQ
jgi:hypothetical protein